MLAERKPVAEVILGGMDRRIQKRFWTTRSISFAVSGGLMLLALVYFLAFADRSSRLFVETQRLTISPVIRGAFQEFIPVSGSILPRESFFLDASRHR